MKHVLSILVENKPGVLSRVTGLFSRRGFNIESLNVAPTEDESFSRITAVVDADEVSFEQITKQLYKLINVAKLTDYSGSDSIQRELVFIKVNASADKRSEITDTALLLGAKTVDVGASTLTFECCGDSNKIEDLIRLLSNYGIVEIIRTGTVALARSQK